MIRVQVLLAVAMTALVVGCERPAPVAPPVAGNDDWRARTLAFQPKGGLPRWNWNYSNEADVMTAGRLASACVGSDEEVTLRAPYDDTRTRLCFYRSRGRLVANFSLVGDGQIPCGAGTGCVIKVRGDDGPAVNFRASVPSDYSSDVVIVANAQALLARVRASKVLRIEATYYEAGAQVSTFRVEGLGEGEAGAAWRS